MTLGNKKLLNDLGKRQICNERQGRGGGERRGKAKKMQADTAKYAKGKVNSQ